MPVAGERVLNRKLSQIFRMRGLALRPDAMQPLYDVLQGDDGWENTLHAILAEVQHQELTGGHVDAAAVRGAIGALRQRTTSKPKLPLEVIDAFSMPAVKYDKQRRILVAEPTAPSLHAPAAAKSAMLALRLAMVEGRVRRHDMFKPPVLTNGIAPKVHLELTGIDAMLGRSGVRVVLGLLAEPEEGSFALEDSHASIPLDLSGADVTPGLFTRHAIVLAEGEVQPSGVFRVRQLGLPPPEAIQTSKDSLASFDTLRQAGGSPASVMAIDPRGSKTKTSAVAMQNAMVVVLSDVWLDSPTVLSQLATLFDGYEQVGAETIGSGRTSTPLAAFFTFVLCGNFTSGGLATAHGATTLQGAALATSFKALAQLLQKTPTLAKHAHFVLVPGPDDPSVGAPDVLPRAPLPAFMCADLLQTCNHLELSSSPCRLVVCDQTVVIHREELLVKARRACILKPESGLALHENLVKSLIDGAHLCPLPQAEAAVHWHFDHTLWLHPAPDVLVLADRQPQFQHPYEETLAFNPGGFATDFSWMVYRPASKQVEASSLEG